MDNYLDLRISNDYEKLKKPAQILKNGGIVVFPTETIYGIGVNSLDKTAIEKLYTVKNRPLNKPISLLISNIEMIENVAKDILPEEYALMKAFMPGPLTIILKKKDNISNLLTANTNTIGVRMPANEIALNLINYAGMPIATPSANISGKPSGTNIETIMKDFGNSVDVYIDGGESKLGLASTVVQIVNGIPNILRQGVITEKNIIDILQNM